MIILCKGLKRHFKRIQKVCEFCLLGKKIQINKTQSWIFLPSLRTSTKRKTHYTLKIGGWKW